MERGKKRKKGEMHKKHKKNAIDFFYGSSDGQLYININDVIRIKGWMEGEEEGKWRNGGRHHQEKM